MTVTVQRTAAAALLAISVVALAGGSRPAAAEGVDDVLVRVNGNEILRSEALRAKNRLPAALREMPDEKVMPILVNIVIDSRLMAEQARAQGIAYDADVRAQINFVTDMVLEQAMLSKYISSKLTDQALQDRYETMKSDTADRDQVRARHILLDDEQTAKDIINELRDGADFAELASKQSTGPTAKTGGDLGYFTRTEMVAPFAKAAFGMDIGEYTEVPVQTEFGWHVIKVEDRRMVEMPPFKEIEEPLRQQLALELRKEYVQQLREGAQIEIVDAAAAGEIEARE